MLYYVRVSICPILSLSQVSIVQCLIVRHLIARCLIVLHCPKLPSWGSWGGSVGSAFDSDHVLSVRVPPAELNISAFPPVLRDWVIKDLGISSRVYATGHIKVPLPLIEKRRGLSPGGRFPPSFIHQVIIITGLNKLYDCMFSP